MEHPLSFLPFFSFPLLLLLLFPGIGISYREGKVTAKTFRCTCCRRIRPRNMRVKSQRYCGDRRCQQMRKSKWQHQKEQSDAEYKLNKKQSQHLWLEKNPGYWKGYRKRHPHYCERNRRLQQQRDKSRYGRCNVSVGGNLAKMDTLNGVLNDRTGRYIISPAAGNLVKMDALIVKIVPVSPG